LIKPAGRRRFTGSPEQQRLPFFASRLHFAEASLKDRLQVFDHEPRLALNASFINCWRVGSSRFDRQGKTMFPAPIACEYGPIAAGAGFFLDLLLVSFGISLLLVTAWFVEWPYRSGGPSLQD
jgi:hypothetical protein